MDILFIILIVLASLFILFFLIAFLLRFHIIISYNKTEDFKLFFKAGFIKLKLYPMGRIMSFFTNKESNENENENSVDADVKVAQNKDVKSEGKAKEIKSNLDLLKSEESIFEKIFVIFGIIEKVDIKIYIDVLKLNVIIGRKDAAETAITIGGIYAAVYGSLGVIQNFVYMKKPEIVINPDYTCEKLEADFYLDVKFRLWQIFISAFKIIKYLNESKKSLTAD